MQDVILCAFRVGPCQYFLKILRLRKFKETFKKTYETYYKIAILRELSLIYFLFVASCKIIELWKLLLFLGASCLQTGHL